MPVGMPKIELLFLKQGGWATSGIGMTQKWSCGHYILQKGKMNSHWEEHRKGLEGLVLSLSDNPHFLSFFGREDVT